MKPLSLNPMPVYNSAGILAFAINTQFEKASHLNLRKVMIEWRVIQVNFIQNLMLIWILVIVLT